MGYICGFNGENKTLKREIEKLWKIERDRLIQEGNEDPRDWVKAGKMSQVN